MNEKKADYYLQMLTTLDYLFQTAGEVFWQNQIKNAIKEYQEQDDTVQFIRAFNGMVDSSEIALKSDMKNAIPKRCQKNCNIILKIVLNLSLKAAGRIYNYEDVNLNMLVKENCRYISNINLNGWKCLRCGERYIRKDKIQDFITTIKLSKLTFYYLKSNRLDNLVDLCIHDNLPRSSDDEDYIWELLDAESVTLVKSNLWNCQKCNRGEIDKCGFNIEIVVGKDDYRYELIEKDEMYKLQVI